MWRKRQNMKMVGVAFCSCWFMTIMQPALAQEEYERPPISYAEAEPDNSISRLARELQAGTTTLSHDEQFGYLPALLKSLNVPVSSQTLVFSRTSLQRHRIHPRTPRALYFNDDVYIGYCHLGDVLEISIADPVVGTAFYTLPQEPRKDVVFERQTDSCLICHGGSQTRNIPGHLVRSVYPDASGNPIFASGTYRTEPHTPLARRWGGWYVTGTHGEQSHMGNRVYSGRPRESDALDPAGDNVTSLTDLCRTSAYLSPHSDLVALLVLDHQVSVHNAIVRASFEVRAALFREQQLNQALKAPAGERRESTTRILDGAAHRLVQAILMSPDLELTSPVAGTSSFAAEFVASGPRDDRGRSLRDFDLTRRLFRYPCSYLIASDSMTRLPPELKTAFWTRLQAVLMAKDSEVPADFAHLSAADRVAIREILTATLPGALKESASAAD